jgi:hypothetical protein
VSQGRGTTLTIMSKMLSGKAQDAPRQQEWVSTMVAVVLTTVLVAIAAFVGTRVPAGGDNVSWQDRASSLVRSVGLGSVLDTVESWVYSVNGPG